jgi:hypothetical protein
MCVRRIIGNKRTHFLFGRSTNCIQDTVIRAWPPINWQLSMKFSQAMTRLPTWNIHKTRFLLKINKQQYWHSYCVISCRHMTWCVQFIKGALIMKNIQRDSAMFNWMIMAGLSLL